MNEPADTSAEAVEHEASRLELHFFATYTAALLRALAAERDRLQAEVDRQAQEIASLRLTLGGRTYSADVPEPIGCPIPGACVQVAEIKRLRDALREIAGISNECTWTPKLRPLAAELQDIIRAALSQPPVKDKPDE
jgi:hypothetical protein